jgi:hypothetical protein
MRTEATTDHQPAASSEEHCLHADFLKSSVPPSCHRLSFVYSAHSAPHGLGASNIWLAYSPSHRAGSYDESVSVSTVQNHAMSRFCGEISHVSLSNLHKSHSGDLNFHRWACLPRHWWLAVSTVHIIDRSSTHVWLIGPVTNSKGNRQGWQAW